MADDIVLLGELEGNPAGGRQSAAGDANVRAGIPTKAKTLLIVGVIGAFVIGALVSGFATWSVTKFYYEHQAETKVEAAYVSMRAGPEARYSPKEVERMVVVALDPFTSLTAPAEGAEEGGSTAQITLSVRVWDQETMDRHFTPRTAEIREAVSAYLATKTATDLADRNLVKQELRKRLNEVFEKQDHEIITGVFITSMLVQ